MIAKILIFLQKLNNLQNTKSRRKIHLLNQKFEFTQIYILRKTKRKQVNYNNFCSLKQQ